MNQEKIVNLNENIQKDDIPTKFEDYNNQQNNTLSLPKNKNNNRYHRKYIVDENRVVQLVQYSDFEQDYLNELAAKQELNNKHIK